MAANDAGVEFDPAMAGKSAVDVCSIAGWFGFSCGEAAVADLTGAAELALVIGGVCLSSGPACPASAGTWVLYAGGAASAMNTYDQIVSIFGDW